MPPYAHTLPAGLTLIPSVEKNERVARADSSYVLTILYRSIFFIVPDYLENDPQSLFIVYEVNALAVSLPCKQLHKVLQAVGEKA